MLLNSSKFTVPITKVVFNKLSTCMFALPYITKLMQRSVIVKIYLNKSIFFSVTVKTSIPKAKQDISGETMNIINISLIVIAKILPKLNFDFKRS